MPELPEVETVCRGLNKIIKTQKPQIEGVVRSKKALRFAWPRGFQQKIKGAELLKVSRRAKYLLFETTGPSFLCHLGMTGNWRLENEKYTSKTHDHLQLKLQNGRTLIYNDTRRFGFFDWVDLKHLETSKWFSHLGPEPLDAHSFNADTLFQASRNKQVSVKVFIMDQKVVVGVGNIYASEALFLSGILPTKKAGALTQKHCQKLVESIRQVLSLAIEQGGTTIRDFKSAGGSEGYFQQKLNVYGKSGESCPVCSKAIKKAVLGGRSTFWCSRCQK